MKMLLGMWDRNRKLEKAFDHLPLNEADNIIIGRSTQLYQEVLEHGPDDDYWKPVNFSSRVPEANHPDLPHGWLVRPLPRLATQRLPGPACCGTKSLFTHRPLVTRRILQ